MTYDIFDIQRRIIKADYSPQQISSYFSIELGTIYGGIKNKFINTGMGYTVKPALKSRDVFKKNEINSRPSIPDLYDELTYLKSQIFLLLRDNIWDHEVQEKMIDIQNRKQTINQILKNYEQI